MVEFLADFHNFTQKWSINRLEKEGKLPYTRQNIYHKAKVLKEKQNRG